MSAQIIKGGPVWQNGGASFLARLRSSSGSLLTQATTSSITCIVHDMTLDGQTTIITPTITVASVIYDTLQTGTQWTKDSTGYNFKYDIAATAFPSAGHIYVTQFKVTPSSGAVFFFQYMNSSLETFSS